MLSSDKEAEAKGKTKAKELLNGNPITIIIQGCRSTTANPIEVPPSRQNVVEALLPMKS